MAVAIGPLIGGVLAGFNFTILFVIDCVISLITAWIVWQFLPETKPEQGTTEKEEETFLKTLANYQKVFSDRIFLSFILLTTLTSLVYIQMNTTLAVFLSKFHGIGPGEFGVLLSINAGMVVVFQNFITKKISRLHMFLAMSIGNFLYGLGFGLFGFTAHFWQFVSLIVIITLGELVIAPVILALISHLAPEDMRGRYMAAFHVGWGTARSFGPWIAGWLIDYSDPNLIWYVGGILCVVVAIGYLILKKRVGERFEIFSNIDTNTVQ